MLELAGMYPEQTAYVIGKGPSLGFLRSEHFHTNGPVIALNQAIAVVERLDIPNPIYSLQKDGCGYVGPHSHCLQRDGVDWMIRPKKATLILQDTEEYSRNCLHGYEPRVLVCPVRDLGFEHLSTMAVRMGIAIAKQMGCGHIKMVSCGSLVNGNTETFNVWTGIAEETPAGMNYIPAKTDVLHELSEIEHSFFIPKPHSEAL